MRLKYVKVVKRIDIEKKKKQISFYTEIVFIRVQILSLVFSYEYSSLYRDKWSKMDGKTIAPSKNRSLVIYFCISIFKTSVLVWEGNVYHDSSERCEL